MLLIDSPHLPPAESVALDELLLEKAEASELGQCLRLWTTPHRFVVMGRGGRADTECHVSRCAKDGVAILKRPSGGGTVLIGPGCLGWTVILNHKADPRLADVKESYQIILGRIASALAALGIPARVACCTDLAVGVRKVGGNAQLRRRTYLLHHGTLLCGFDIAQVRRYLKHPPREPAYRRGRTHGRFMTNLPLTTEAAAAAVRAAFTPSSNGWTLTASDHERLAILAQRMLM